MKRLSSTLFCIILLLNLIGCNLITDPRITPTYQPELNTPSQIKEYETDVPGALPTKQTSANNSGNPGGLLKVHFLDVGQADSILIQTPQNKVMLIDAGNNADGSIVVSYIKSQGISKIDVVIGTHPHEDHIGGLDRVINSFDIDSIYMPDVSINTNTFKDVLTAIKNNGLKITSARSGVNINLDNSLKTEMLAPNSDSYDDLNNYSAVIKITYNHTSFLFTGDAESLSEKEVLSAGYDLKADVLKVGHHGSGSSTGALFLRRVSPKHAIISVGKNNKYNHPDDLILNRLKIFGIEVFRTDESGTIIATSDGNTINFNE